jgi:hypothetical protein
MPSSGLDWIKDQVRMNADSVIFAMNAQMHKDEMKKALGALAAHVLCMSDTSGRPLMVLVSRSDGKVFIGWL